MKHPFCIATLLWTVGLPLVVGCSPRAQAPSAATTTNQAESEPAAAIDEGTAEEIILVAPSPLDPKRLERLLDRRPESGLPPDISFGQFARFWLFASHAEVGTVLSLLPATKAIAETRLQSPFPKFYKPKVKELLDAISLQTFSQWNYDPSAEGIARAKAELTSELREDQKGDVEDVDIAVFNFAPTQRVKPFEITLAAGWAAADKGNWVTYMPPVFPVGMDIYEMGTYSSDGKMPLEELLGKVKTDVSLAMVGRAREGVRGEDLKAAKVGVYDAMFFETIVRGTDGGDVHWRQWVFMVDDRCYLVLSTVLPQFKNVIYPAVDAMLASFRAKPNAKEADGK